MTNDVWSIGIRWREKGTKIIHKCWASRAICLLDYFKDESYFHIASSFYSNSNENNIFLALKITKHKLNNNERSFIWLENVKTKKIFHWNFIRHFVIQRVENLKRINWNLKECWWMMSQRFRWNLNAVGWKYLMDLKSIARMEN